MKIWKIGIIWQSHENNKKLIWHIVRIFSYFPAILFSYILFDDETTILFFLGSGPIKGFSITLGVGIFTTLFSVYFIARLLTSLYVTRNKNKESLI